MRFFLFFILIISLSACQSSIKTQRANQFNADSLINALVHALNSQQAALTKATYMGDKSYKIEIAGNDVNWEQELEIFRSLAQINKPTYDGLYRVHSISDTVSNLIIKSWICQKDAPLQTLRVYYLNTPDQLRKLEAIFSVSNFLYQSRKKMTLEFEAIDTPPHLESYQVEVHQRLIMSAAGDFTLKGFINIK